MPPTTTYFYVYEKLPSLNDYINACRTNRFKAANLKSETENIILLYLKEYESKGYFSRLSNNTQYSFFFTWFEQTRRRDVDNVISAKKFVFDALQKGGYLANDSQKHVFGIYDKVVINTNYSGVYVVVMPRKSVTSAEIVDFFAR